MLAAGSDWSVSTMDPMQIIQTGVTHRLIDQPDSPPWNPHERLDLLTMLEAYTVNTAYALRFDDCTGSLEAGKDASFAILDRNPFAHPVETFAQARVIETCFRGEVVYAAPAGPSDARTGRRHATPSASPCSVVSTSPNVSDSAASVARWSSRCGTVPPSATSRSRVAQASSTTITA